ncbi:MAG: methyl-accepting chemotaxis protein, partial [Gammaproteobacteria bacterium]|nr:methyl-accepting chemotaxis protein [Gammaproteobacteria bacterium]
AVVADEVRTLAGRTQQSTEEINQMIGRLQAGSRRAVGAMNQSRDQAHEVAQQAVEAGTALSTISEAVSRISEMSVQIASAAEEQGTVSEEINRNVVRVHDLATQTATGADQSTQAGRDLVHMAADLQELISQFRN